jgi:GntR family transcriptional regulator, N-acetylglucosamine utilization regulator
MEILFNDLKQLNRPRNPDNTPLYERLQRVLHDAIDSGSLQPGRALPSERELAKLASLSRVTVRKAIAALVSKGLLTQRHGAGTFVSERIVKSFSKLTSFSDDLRARGFNPRSRFLERSVGEVTPDEAMALGLSPGRLVVRLYRLRFAGEAPLAIERSSIPHSILSDPQAVKSSLYDALDRVGCRPQRALQRLRAIIFDAEQSRLLSIPRGTAGLMIERRAFLNDGRAVEYTRSLYRGDVYDFVAELHSD